MQYNTATFPYFAVISWKAGYINPNLCIMQSLKGGAEASWTIFDGNSTTPVMSASQQYNFDAHLSYKFDSFL